MRQDEPGRGGPIGVHDWPDPPVRGGRGERPAGVGLQAARPGGNNVMSDDATRLELTADSTVDGRSAQLQHTRRLPLGSTGCRPVGVPGCRSCWCRWRRYLNSTTCSKPAYIPPGLVRDGIFRTASEGFLGQSDQATFAAATFFGLFLGAIGFSSVADRFGRRRVFVWALLAYKRRDDAAGVPGRPPSASICAGCLPASASAWNSSRSMHTSSRSCPSTCAVERSPLNHFVEFCAVPVLAFLAWVLIPRSPFGISAGRYVVVLARGRCVVRLVDPARLAGVAPLARPARPPARGPAHRRGDGGQGGERPAGRSPPSQGTPESPSRASFAEIWKPPHARRTIMLVVFNFFQTIGFFGFTNWLPTLLATNGQSFSESLFYSFCIAFAYPLSALFWSVTVAKRFERKWLIVAAAVGVAVCGPLFAVALEPALLVTTGILITGFSILLSLSYHPYQAELYPTRLRARRGRLRLFLQPDLDRPHQLPRRLLSAAFRHRWRLWPDLCIDADRSPVDRDLWAADTRTRPGRRLALTRRPEDEHADDYRARAATGNCVLIPCTRPRHRRGRVRRGAPRRGPDPGAGGHGGPPQPLLLRPGVPGAEVTVLVRDFLAGT